MQGVKPQNAVLHQQLYVLKKLNIPYGTYTTKFCLGEDDERMVVMERKSSDNVKSRSKQPHAKKKAFTDANEEKDDTVYRAGLFQIFNYLVHYSVLKLYIFYLYVIF